MIKKRLQIYDKKMTKVIKEKKVIKSSSFIPLHDKLVASFSYIYIYRIYVYMIYIYHTSIYTYIYVCDIYIYIYIPLTKCQKFYYFVEHFVIEVCSFQDKMSPGPSFGHLFHYVHIFRGGKRYQDLTLNFQLF